MTTISEAVRGIIRDRPFLEDALARNIINYNSLAEEMKEEIDIAVGKPATKVSSIAMALRRLGKDYEKKYDRKIEQKLTEFVGSDTTIRYDLFEITLELTPKSNLSSLISKIYSELKITSSDFLSITKGNSEITIITQKRFKEKIEKICYNFAVKDRTMDLAALSIKIPEESQTTPGLFYLFSKTLTLKGINIAELVSTWSEMQIILDEADIEDAAKAIRKLVKNTKAYD